VKCQPIRAQLRLFLDFTAPITDLDRAFEDCELNIWKNEAQEQLKKVSVQNSTVESPKVLGRRAKRKGAILSDLQGFLAPIGFIGCTSMVMDNGFYDDDDGINLLLGHLHRRRHKSNNLEEYPGIVSQRHEEFTEKLPRPPKPNLRCESMKTYFHSPRWYTGEMCKPDS
jgi:hypothetical protein